MVLAAAWRRWREAKALRRRAVPEALWRSTLESLSFLRGLSEEEEAELRRLTSLFLHDKTFIGAGGLEVNDTMAVQIAVQAVLPLLKLGLEPYAAIRDVVIHESDVLAAREFTDEAGIVHAYEEELSGESALHVGRVMLTWQRIAEPAHEEAASYNLVLHEFAHVLDLGNGLSDGIPALPSAAAKAAWHAALEPAYERLRRQVFAGEETVLDAYGSEGIDEFFAISVEAFFVQPQAMREACPDWYACLAGFFRQDPAARQSQD